MMEPKFADRTKKFPPRSSITQRPSRPHLNFLSANLGGKHFRFLFNSRIDKSWFGMEKTSCYFKVFFDLIRKGLGSGEGFFFPNFF